MMAENDVLKNVDQRAGDLFAENGFRFFGLFAFGKYKNTLSFTSSMRQYNYAANSLTYSSTLNSNFPAGQKRNDRTLGMDLSLGTGLTSRWDVGVNVPFDDNEWDSSFHITGTPPHKHGQRIHIGSVRLHPRPRQSPMRLFARRAKATPR